MSLFVETGGDTGGHGPAYRRRPAATGGDDRRPGGEDELEALTV
jgi:hypothetical protein